MIRRMKIQEVWSHQHTRKESKTTTIKEMPVKQTFMDHKT